MKDLDQDQILLYTADELALFRDRLNKEIERRNGKDIDIKKKQSPGLQTPQSLRLRMDIRVLPRRLPTGH
jgi:hypothetical protein